MKSLTEHCSLLSSRLSNIIWQILDRPNCFTFSTPFFCSSEFFRIDGPAFVFNVAASVPFSAFPSTDSVVTLGSSIFSAKLSSNRVSSEVCSMSVFNSVSSVSFGGNFMYSSYETFALSERVINWNRGWESIKKQTNLSYKLRQIN